MLLLLPVQVVLGPAGLAIGAFLYRRGQTPRTARAYGLVVNFGSAMIGMLFTLAFFLRIFLRRG